MSPHPLLTASVQELAGELDADRVLAIGSLRREEPERATLLAQAAELYVRGHVLDFGAVQGGGARRVVSLPPYRWQKERHWFDANAESRLARGPAAAMRAAPVERPEGDLRTAALAAPAGRAREAVLEGRVRDELAGVLRLPAGRVDRTKPFRDLGLDSLMGLELRKRLERASGVALPVTAIWNHSTVARLAVFLGERLSVPPVPPPPQCAAASADNDADALDALISELEQLSDDEAARLLKEDA